MATTDVEIYARRRHVDRLAGVDVGHGHVIEFCRGNERRAEKAAGVDVDVVAAGIENSYLATWGVERVFGHDAE